MVFALFLQGNIVWNDVLKMAIIHAEALRDDAKSREAEPFVEMQSTHIVGYDSVELQNAETETGSHCQRVLHQLLTDMLPPTAFLHGVAGVADVTAAAYIVGMENIQANNLACRFVHRNSCIRLALKETPRLFQTKRF